MLLLRFAFVGECIPMLLVLPLSIVQVLLHCCSVGEHFFAFFLFCACTQPHYCASAPTLVMSKAAIIAKQKRDRAIQIKAAEINAQKWQRMRAQLERFELHLQEFAHSHKQSIQNDPAFRAQFHRMCATVGVDPLTSRKGMWAELLGVGDYYFELGVRAIEACVATRPLNAGVISLTQLVRHLRKRRSAYSVTEITADDVERAVLKLAVLGGGYRVVDAGRGKVVTSVPMELSLDHTRVLAVCSTKAWTTIKELRANTGWDDKRARAAVDYLMNAEIAWIDTQTPEHAYWVLGLLPSASTTSGEEKRLQ